jgi:hypothetical protein
MVSWQIMGTAVNKGQTDDGIDDQQSDQNPIDVS